MLQTLKNIWFLSGKEVKSVLSDYTLMGLIIIIFSISTIAVVKGISVEVKEASIAVVNEDNSSLSYRLIDAFKPPYFQTVQYIEHKQIDPLMNKGDFTFILVIPENFEKDLIQQRPVSLQLLSDASVVSQAGLGVAYIEQIVQQTINRYFKQADFLSRLALNPVTHVWFNPNTIAAWFTGPTQVMSNVTLLGMLLVGAAIIREKERGTIEHLLVMPVKAHEIVISKIISNSLVITIAAILSLYLVVHLWLGVPIAGSIPLFILCVVIYLFSVCSLGIFLATLTPTMPQFGLLCIPLYVIMLLLSGAETPVESMPEFIQSFRQILPMSHFVEATLNILVRDADISIISQSLLYLILMGSVFFALAMFRFRKMLSQQN